MKYFLIVTLDKLTKMWEHAVVIILESLMRKEHYVYLVEVDGVLRYVGKGKGRRFEHCTSGKSSCAELNRDFFDNKTITVTFHQKDLTEKDAELLESEMINKYKDQLYNKVSGSRQKKLTSVQLRKDITILERQFAFTRDTENSALLKHINKLSGNMNVDIHCDAFKELECRIAAAGLELVLVKLDGHTPMVMLDTWSQDEKLTCLGCGSYPGETAKCLDRKSSWCQLRNGSKFEDVPGWKS